MNRADGLLIPFPFLSFPSPTLPSSPFPYIPQQVYRLILRSKSLELPLIIYPLSFPVPIVFALRMDSLLLLFSVEQHVTVSPLELPLKPLSLRLGMLDEVLDVAYLTSDNPSEGKSENRFIGVATNAKEWRVYDLKSQSWLIEQDYNPVPFPPPPSHPSFTHISIPISLRGRDLGQDQTWISFPSHPNSPTLPNL